jgi:hypothetical protein
MRALGAPLSGVKPPRFPPPFFPPSAHILPSQASPQGTSTVIDDDSSLFDFITPAALSEYGAVQRVLLAPSTTDSRDILQAISQLMLFEQWQQRGQAGRLHQRQQQRCTGHGLSSRPAYKELKAMCHQVG